jgi:hypothetical protein
MRSSRSSIFWSFRICTTPRKPPSVRTWYYPPQDGVKRSVHSLTPKDESDWLKRFRGLRARPCRISISSSSWPNIGAAGKCLKMVFPGIGVSDSERIVSGSALRDHGHLKMDCFIIRIRKRGSCSKPFAICRRFLMRSTRSSLNRSRHLVSVAHANSNREIRRAEQTVSRPDLCGDESRRCQIPRH